MKSWFQINAMATGSEIVIYDEIGFWGVQAAEMVREIAGLPNGDIHLHINSPGGSVPETIAIVNALRRHDGRVIAHIDGVAASAASLLAATADEVRAPSNTMLMLHRPWGSASGDSDDMRSYADLLDKSRDQMLAEYVGKTGDAHSETITGWLADGIDHWLSAAEAFDIGLVDVLEEPIRIVAMWNKDKLPAAPAALLSAIETVAEADVEAETATEAEVEAAPVVGEDHAIVDLDPLDAEAAVEIRAACAALDARDKADGFIAARVSLDDVIAQLRTEMWDRKAAEAAASAISTVIPEPEAVVAAPTLSQARARQETRFNCRP